jgi:hypothetical protein
MFPQYNMQVNIETLSETIATSGRVFLFDFVTKQHVFKDGKPVEATYYQAIQQWLTILIITESDKYEIYKDSGFGLSINQFIGRRDIPIGVINSELKRQIEEKSILHPEIIEIQNFTITREDGQITISFNVITRQGSLVDINVNLQSM